MAEGSQTAKRVPVPHYACRIVGIGKNQETAPVVADSLEIVKIHRIASVRIFNQRIIDHFPVIAFRHKTERMIDRRLDDDLVVRLEESIDYQTYALYDTRDVSKPFAFCLPAVMGQDPLLHRRPVISWLNRIAENRVLKPLAEGLHDERRRLEIHIRNPERDEVRVTVAFPQSIGLQGSGAAPFDNLVKIVSDHFSVILFDRHSHQSSA